MSFGGTPGTPTNALNAFQSRFRVSLMDPSLSYKNVSVMVRGTDNKFYQCKQPKQGHGIFVPEKVGMHEIIVRYDGEEVSVGNYFRVLPQLVEVAPPGMAPCALGSLVQVLVNATGACASGEAILVIIF